MFQPPRSESDVTLPAVLDHLDRTPQVIHDFNLLALVDHYQSGTKTAPVAKAHGRRRPVGPALAAMLRGKPV